MFTRPKAADCLCDSDRTSLLKIFVHDKLFLFGKTAAWSVNFDIINELFFALSLTIADKAKGVCSFFCNKVYFQVMDFIVLWMHNFDSVPIPFYFKLVFGEGEF